MILHVDLDGTSVEYAIVGTKKYIDAKYVTALKKERDELKTSEQNSNVRYVQEREEVKRLVQHLENIESAIVCLPIADEKEILDQVADSLEKALFKHRKENQDNVIEQPRG